MPRKSKLFKFDSAEQALSWAYLMSMTPITELEFRFTRHDVITAFNGLVKRNRCIPLDLYLTKLYITNEYTPKIEGRNMDSITDTLEKLEKDLIRKKIVVQKKTTKPKEEASG